MYREPQVGGNCRIHSLNAFFQEQRITLETFAKYAARFDEYLKKYNLTVKSSDFDLVNSDQNNIVCYILKKEMPNFSTKYFAINYHFINQANVASIIGMSEFCFIYSLDHIWAIKKQNDKWFVLDSLRPIIECLIKDLMQQKNIGFIPVIPAKISFDIEFHNISTNIDLAQSAVISYKNIVAFIVKHQADSTILGEIETSINICVDLLESNGQIWFPDHIKLTQRIVAKYNEFLPIFTAGNYNNLELKVRYLPYIIYGIKYICRM